jgi:class 3 adenylate cyclase
MDLRKLGSRIKQRREARRLRQADIAGALQISAQAVSKWERGENAPDISILIHLSQLLGVSVEWLLEGRADEEGTFAATVFCSDLRGFARKARDLAPRDLATLANGIYFTITEAVIRFDGVPVKNIGDGILAFFSGPNHASRALRAAQVARVALTDNHLVAALSSGEILFDTMGHPDYASKDILGPPVNTAFLTVGWIGEHCQSGIGLTEATAQQLDETFDTRPRGHVDILGQDDPVTLYELKPNEPTPHRGVFT